MASPRVASFALPGLSMAAVDAADRSMMKAQLEAAFLSASEVGLDDLEKIDFAAADQSADGAAATVEFKDTVATADIEAAVSAVKQQVADDVFQMKVSSRHAGSGGTGSPAPARKLSSVASTPRQQSRLRQAESSSSFGAGSTA